MESSSDICYIWLFGGLRIERWGGKISAPAGKPAALLAYLATQNGRRMKWKDLAEHAWHYKENGTLHTSGDVATAVSTINNLLKKPHILESVEDPENPLAHYKLRRIIVELVGVDINYFQEALKRASRSTASIEMKAKWLLDAISLHTMEGLLPNVELTQSMIDLRDELRGQYRRAMVDLAKLYASTGQYEEAVKWVNQVLDCRPGEKEIDFPDYIEACWLLLRIFSRTHLPSGALRCFSQFLQHARRWSISIPDDLKFLVQQLNKNHFDVGDWPYGDLTDIRLPTVAPDRIKLLTAPDAEDQSSAVTSHDHVTQSANPDDNSASEVEQLRAEAMSPSVNLPRMNNLPEQLTSFIGREKEKATLRSLLDKDKKQRLVTLTGSGGCGKTRLALEMATELIDSYKDGVWFVELARIGNPASVSQIVASVLGVTEEKDKPLNLTLSEHLRSKQLLLLLDNCEHVLDDCAQLADRLLRFCPKVRLLATSREALSIAGEQIYRVLSLSLPDPNRDVTIQSVTQFEAVQLFIDRAHQVNLDFAVTDNNASVLASLCCRLDGIPLAIELAAAKVDMRTVEEINHLLNDRFRLLTGGNRCTLPKSQTLKAVIDWSYERINDKEKMLLLRLSVFAGGWMLEAAEKVCSGGDIKETEVINMLTSLTKKSLVMVEMQNTQTRYRLLETVREFAWEQLDDTSREHISQEHYNYFLQVVENGHPSKSNVMGVGWLDQLEMEHANLLYALEWCRLRGDNDKLSLLSLALFRFWLKRGHWVEGCRWIETVQKDILSVRQHARLLHAEGTFALSQGNYKLAISQLKKCLTITRKKEDQDVIAQAMNTLGNVYAAQGDYPHAEKSLRKSVAIARKIDSPIIVAMALNNLANLLDGTGDYEQARQVYEDCKKICVANGYRADLVHVLNGLGNLAHIEGDYKNAYAIHLKALKLRQEIGTRPDIAATLTNLANSAQMLGMTDEAEKYYKDALFISEQVGNRPFIAMIKNDWGNVANYMGNYELAGQLFDESRLLNAEIGNPAREAMALANCGSVFLNQGDPDEARKCLLASLRLYGNQHNKQGIADVLSNLGLCAYYQEEWDIAQAYQELSLVIPQGILHQGRTRHRLALVKIETDNFDEAQCLLKETIKSWQSKGSLHEIAEVLEAFGALAVRSNSYKLAARYFGTAEALRYRLKSKRIPPYRELHDRSVKVLRARLEEPALSESWSEGRHMIVEEALNQALDSSYCITQ